LKQKTGGSAYTFHYGIITFLASLSFILDTEAVLFIVVTTRKRTLQQFKAVFREGIRRSPAARKRTFCPLTFY